MRLVFCSLILIILLNVVALIKPIALALQTNKAADDVVVCEHRLLPLRKILSKRAVLGYLTDGEVTKDNRLRLDACRRFYMTQYALSPAVVVHDQSLDLVVGNFTSAEAMRRALDATDLKVAADFGDGIVLLRHEAKR